MPYYSIPSSLNELTDMLFLDLDVQQWIGTVAEISFDIATLQTLDLKRAFRQIYIVSNWQSYQFCITPDRYNNIPGPIPNTFYSLTETSRWSSGYG